jgi:hypothetical protein
MSSNDNVRYIASLSLTKGQLVSPLFQIRACKHMCLLGDTFLAGICADELWVYDRSHGALLQQYKLPHDNVLGLTSEKNRIAVLLQREQHVCVATAALMNATLSLAERLTCALQQSHSGINNFGARRTIQLTARRINNMMLTKAEENADSNLHIVDTAIQVLAQVFNDIENGSTASRQSSFLADGFETALRCIVPGEPFVDGNQTMQNDKPPARAKKNGVHHHGSEKKKNGVTTNGNSALNEMESSCPKPFNGPIPKVIIDALATLLVKLLSSPAVPEPILDDARILMKRILGTGAISARQHFCSESFPALLHMLEIPAGTDDETVQASYSSVDFVFDLLQYCSDLSEYHMVTMLRYFLTRVRADDIASHFCYEKKDWSQNVIRVAYRYKSSRNQDKYAAKLIVSASECLLKRIFLYSNFNEALLRIAVGDILNKSQIVLTARLLSKYISTANTDGTTPLKRAIHWLTIIAEHLNGSMRVSESIDMSRIRETISDQLSKTECLLSLQDVLYQAESSAKKPRLAVGAPVRDLTSLPGYQIERLMM